MAKRRSLGTRVAAALGLCLCATAALARDAAQDAKRGDGQYQEKQGHMLLLNGDAYVMARDLKGAPTTALTVEAWMRSTDDCADGTLLSYAVNPEHYPGDDSTDNEFALFSTREMMVCRGFRYYAEPRDDWLGPPLYHDACDSFYADQPALERRFTDDKWHHVAAVWTAHNNGTVKIYKDGLLASSVETARTAPLRPGGVWVIGGEQDCFGGCLDPAQSFHGALDDVRLWSVERTQEQIMRSMFDTRDIRTGRDVHGLVGFWTFDDAVGSSVLSDAGMHGNHLALVRAPVFDALVDSRAGDTPHLVPARKHADAAAPNHSSLAFDNTYALARTASGMPTGDFTVELWVRTPALPEGKTHQVAPMYALFSYAAQRGPGHGRSGEFMDDAILLQLLNSGAYLDESGGGAKVRLLRANLDVWINAASRAGAVPEEAEGVTIERLVFDTPTLVDGEWHHVAVSWQADSGLTRAYVDGGEVTPIAGAEPTLARGTSRSGTGSVALGQDQDCPGTSGGCFSSSQALHGALAEVRVWRTERSSQQIRDAMAWPWRAEAPADATPDVLAARWTFDAEDRSPGCNSTDGDCVVRAVAPSAANIPLTVSSPAALRTLSDAPHQPLSVDMPSFKAGIASGDFKHVAVSGHALALSEQQVLINSAVHNFPSSALTLEFWMRSVDKCGHGTPFSYATGSGKYGVSDNSFTLVDYNDWAIAVNEDQGSMMNSRAGVSSTTGDWAHVAVTWNSAGGRTQLYLDGTLVWKTVRAPNTHIPSGGTLVVGREQDCRGGCFDSKKTAAGDLDEEREYGSQDFYGVIDEMRLWRVERSAAQIKETMETYSSTKLASHTDLVAYWMFDEGVGRIVRDKSGHGNDLVLTHEPQWVVSTIAEKKADREARPEPGDGSGAPPPHAAGKRSKKKHTALVIIFVLGGIAGAVAAFMRREDVGFVLGAVLGAAAAGVQQVLARTRRLLGRSAPSSSSYQAMGAMDFADVDAAEAEPLTGYRPPPPLGEEM